ncbi:MAG TPA: hypothetical protein VKY74_16615, partial [Chloroflexia bacterium]|nr:hypothetical protein [Chloroflexia bacterium]
MVRAGPALPPPVSEILSSFLPMDRRQALATGQALPRRAAGAALLADLAGFTTLTATLAAAYG